MTTWRDIADQLTETQVGYLERLEREPLPGRLLAKPEQHLFLARGWATENLEQSLHADVPPPEGAVEVGPWRNSPSGSRCRDYTTAGIGVADIAGIDVTLEVRGTQFTDGRVDGRLGLSGEGLRNLDLAAARRLAEALLSAIDRFQGR